MANHGEMVLALNATRKTLLASRVRFAEEGGLRAVAAAAPVHPGDGLLLRRRGPIDTRGMPGSLDFLFLDADNRVVGVVHEIPPNAPCPPVDRAVGVLELPAGTLSSTHTQLSDRILIEPVRAGNTAG